MKRNQARTKSTPSRSKNRPITQRQPETKHFVTGTNIIAFDTAPTSTNPALYKVGSLCNIAHGDGQTDRTGIKVQARKLQFRCKVSIDPNSTSTFANLVANAHEFRVTIIHDRFPNGVVPDWDEVFQVYTNNNGQLYDWIVAWHKKRFKAVFDKFIKVPPSYVVYDGATYHALGNNAHLEVDIPLNCDIMYSDGESNTSSIQENNFFVFFSSDASSTAYTQCKFSYRSNLQFQDY